MKRRRTSAAYRLRCTATSWCGYAAAFHPRRLPGENEAGATSVCVENVGRETPLDHLHRIFDRFHRADSARENSGAHHGLGLAIVAAVARMHGGRVFASSGGGRTRVGFTLGAPQSLEGAPARDFDLEFYHLSSSMRSFKIHDTK